jgi:hypothetical protein
MHWKLFATIAGAVVVAAVLSYVIIGRLRSHRDVPQLAVSAPKGEIGFAALMKKDDPKA